MNTLNLTSPYTKGKVVKQAQQHLAANVFGQSFYKGAIDGEFGELSAQACIRAKYWLGYPVTRQHGSYGDELDGYLTGTALPGGFLAEREARLQPKKPLRALALEEAKRHIGEKESPPNSNKIRYSAWYGVVGPWCAMFVSWCYVQSDSKAFAKGVHYAYVPFIVHDARAGANGLSITHDPKPGDLVCFDWEGNGVADHVGLFERWTAKGSTFDSIEGNTAVGNDSNGGEVMRRHRQLSQVQAFVHVGR